MNREVVIVEAVRTPVGKRNGALRNNHPVDLAAAVLHQVVDRIRLSKNLVEDIIIGCVTPVKEQAWNIGRLAALQADFPVETPAVQINRMCGSGQQAIHFAAQSILAGDIAIAIGAGVEHMSTIPIWSDGNEQTIPTTLKQKYEFIHQGLAAERIAQKYGLTRKELDQYAFESHQFALIAQQERRFTREIIPLVGIDKEGNPFSIVEDEGPRADTSLEILATLPPVFQEDGRITAGNASQISDGAAAVLLMEKRTADALGIRPRAKILARVVVGSDPTIMLDGIIPATQKVLAKIGRTIDEIDLFEVNEAFASVVLAWQKVFGVDRRKINVNGGAIALGHPLGATGAKLLTTLLHELERQQKQLGLLTICIGHGMATAMVIERC